MSDANNDQLAQRYTPSTGPMTFIPWSGAGGWRFCSCGNWHWEPAPSQGQQKGVDDGV
jgi:hypothetical protein